MLKQIAALSLIASALALVGCAKSGGAAPTITPVDIGLPTSVSTSAASSSDVTATPDPFDHYPTGTLSALTEYAVDHIADDATVVVKDPNTNARYSFDAGINDDPLVRAAVTYTTECRTISPERLAMMTMWVNRYNPDVAGLFTDLFKQECRYTEGDTDYWLPTQEFLVEDLANNLLNGQTVTLYVQYLGTILAPDDNPANNDHIMIVNQYHIDTGS